MVNPSHRKLGSLQIRMTDDDGVDIILVYGSYKDYYHFNYHHNVD